MQQVNIVDAQSRILTANATSEPDLYWACRGGGGGSFGIATEFKLHVFPLASALVFGVSWKLTQAQAAKLFAAWPAWAPNAPANITPIMKVGSAGGGAITLRCIGQSVGSESELRAQLHPLVTMVAPSSALSIQSLSFLDAVKHFAGPLDYEFGLYEGEVGLRADAAGGRCDPGDDDGACGDSGRRRGAAVRRLWRQDRRRRGRRHGVSAARGHAILHPVLFGAGPRAADAPVHIANVAKIYAAMRPFMPGASYVNYCDLDLPDYATAYWGDNLPRLMAVKAAYDPQNLFRHAQSVPLPPAPAAQA